MSHSPILVRVDPRLLVLRPEGTHAQEMMAELPLFGEFWARLDRITRKGEIERDSMRRLWFGGCGVLAENVGDPDWDTKMKVHNNLKLHLGYWWPRFRRGGSFDPVPLSTRADGGMNDVEFAILQEKARAFCIGRFDFDPWQHWSDMREIERREEARRLQWRR